MRDSRVSNKSCRPSSCAPRKNGSKSGSESEAAVWGAISVMMTVRGGVLKMMAMVHDVGVAVDGGVVVAAWSGNSWMGTSEKLGC